MNLTLTILDQPAIYIQGFANLLMQNGIFNEVSQHATKTDFLESYKSNPTDFVILGSQEKGIFNLIDLIEVIKMHSKKVNIAVVGNYFEINDIRKLFELGIKCYLDKDTQYDEFVEAVKVMKLNNIYVCSSAKERMIGYISHQNDHEWQNTESLTRREVEVMKLICEGYSSKEISEKLFISINTVESHRKKILMKLNVKNSIGIVKYATENNMLE